MQQQSTPSHSKHLTCPGCVPPGLPTLLIDEEEEGRTKFVGAVGVEEHILGFKVGVSR